MTNIIDFPKPPKPEPVMIAVPKEEIDRIHQIAAEAMDLLKEKSTQPDRDDRLFFAAWCAFSLVSVGVMIGATFL